MKERISLSKLLRLDQKTIRRVFVLSALLFFAAHIYRFTSASYSHDALLINQSDDTLFQISLGRFLQPLYWKFRGDIPAPFLVGFAACAFLSLSILLITSLLGFRSLLSIALTCSVLCVNATLITAGGSYISWMDVYMLAFLLAITSVFVCARWRFGFLAAPLFLCASLALYQCYIQTAALLMLMLLVRSALRGGSPKAFILDAFKYLFVLLSGILLYMLILKAVLSAANVSLSQAPNSLLHAGQYEGISILSLLRDTYLYPFRYMSSPETHLSRFAALAGLGVFALGCICFMHLLRRHIFNPLTALLSIFAVVLMPFAMNAVYFVSKGYIHTAMLYAFFFSFVFPIYLTEQAAADGRLLHAFQTGAAVLLLFIYGCNFVTAHQLYLRRDLEFQSTLSAMTRVIDRAEQVEGYEPGYTPVAIVSNLSASRLSMIRPGFEHLSTYGVNHYAPTYLESNISYFWQILGYPFNFIDADQQRELSKREDVRAIPAFPAKGCCQMIDGILVIRLGVAGI